MTQDKIMQRLTAARNANPSDTPEEMDSGLAFARDLAGDAVPVFVRLAHSTLRYCMGHS